MDGKKMDGRKMRKKRGMKSRGVVKETNPEVKGEGKAKVR